MNVVLGRQLAQDELFDLTLYRRLQPHVSSQLRGLFDELIPAEERHLAFWQEFFVVRVDRLDARHTLKLWLMLWVARVAGDRFVHLLLESIEVHGIRTYLEVWEQYRHTELGAAVRGILEDELGHEDEILTRFLGPGRRVDAEVIRNIFLGMNDGLVEMLGAVSGFFAAFGNASHVIIAALTVAVAGSFSMAAGVYVSSGSQKEVERTERRKLLFLGQGGEGYNEGVHPLRQAWVVGVAYFVGALVPVGPVLFGARNVLFSVAAAGSIIILMSFVLSFISGMNTRRRIATNVVITFLAVVVTYVIGTTAKVLFGVAI